MAQRIVSSILGALLPSLLVACMDGTTPDCSPPDAGCGPDLTNFPEGGGDAPLGDSGGDSANSAADTSTADAGPG
jgi:hypothetical protein